MFDIGWSELFVIAVVAIVVVGPKDLPKLLRAFGNTVGKLKRMSSDFQRQFNEAMREAELDDVRKSVEEIGKIDPLADVRKGFEPVERVNAEIESALRQPVWPSSGATPPAAPATEASQPDLPLAMPSGSGPTNGATEPPASPAVPVPPGVSAAPPVEAEPRAKAGTPVAADHSATPVEKPAAFAGGGL